MDPPADASPRRQPHAEEVRRAVETFFNRHFPTLPLPTPLIVAVSGGPDSVCLLNVLHGLFQARGGGLHVAHLHHGQREEGDEDAAFVEELANSLNVPFTMERADVPGIAREERRSIEEAGRVARYRFLARLASDIGAEAVATGHHANDQAETVLLRAFRGAGLRGLRGIPADAPLPETGGGARVIRPLLEVPRATIEAYLKEQGLSSRLDVTNLDLSLQRNRIRHELLPLAEAISPGALQGLLRIARGAAEDEAALEAWTDTICKEFARIDEDRVELLLEDFPKEQAVRRRTLRRAVELLIPETGRGFPESAIDRILREWALGEEGKTLSLPHGLDLQITGDSHTRDRRLVLCRRAVEAVPLTSSIGVSLPGTTEIPYLTLQLQSEFIRPGEAEPFPPRTAWQAVLDVDALQLPLFVRTWQPGDCIKVLGTGGTRKLQDLFTDARIPAADRRRWPLLCDAERIVWAPGIALHDAVKVTPQTHRVVRLELNSSLGE